MFPGCPEHSNAEGTHSEYSRNIVCRLSCLSTGEKEATFVLSGKTPLEIVWHPLLLLLLLLLLIIYSGSTIREFSSPSSHYKNQWYDLSSSGTLTWENMAGTSGQNAKDSNLNLCSTLTN